MLLVLAACLGSTVPAVIGIILGLAGLSTALLCLLALGDGALRRSLIGFVAGLFLLATGLWLVGFLPS